MPDNSKFNLFLGNRISHYAELITFLGGYYLVADTEFQAFREWLKANILLQYKLMFILLFVTVILATNVGQYFYTKFFFLEQLRRIQDTIKGIPLETRQALEMKDVRAGVGKEQEADQIWVISPKLYYDIYQIEFMKVISKNLSENKKYRYLVPMELDNILLRIQKYAHLYSLTKAEVKEMFTLIEGDLHDLSDFAHEIVIFDPKNNEKESTSYAYPSQHANLENDILEFDTRVVALNIENFENLWQKHKAKSDTYLDKNFSSQELK